MPKKAAKKRTPEAKIRALQRSVRKLTGEVAGQKTEYAALAATANRHAHAVREYDAVVREALDLLQASLTKRVGILGGAPYVRRVAP